MDTPSKNVDAILHKIQYAGLTTRRRVLKCRSYDCSAKFSDMTSTKRLSNGRKLLLRRGFSTPGDESLEVTYLTTLRWQAPLEKKTPWVCFL